MKEESVLTKDDASIENGTLYLTDKRLIYEIKGTRKLLSAEPSKIYLMIPIYNAENVSTAVPRFKIFTKKRIRVEYRDETTLKSVEFSVRKAHSWAEEIKKWSITAKASHMEIIKREDEEQFRRTLELTKAKSSKSNINMINLGTPAKGSSGFVKNENRSDTIKDIVVSNSQFPTNPIVTCPECLGIIDPNSKFCKNCGTKLK
ncbi:MAG: zinc ribbon domain-containing protein [Thermoplasmataceae archaeon]